MEGAEVENQGVKMRRTLHWEKRLFGVRKTILLTCGDYNKIE